MESAIGSGFAAGLEDGQAPAVEAGGSAVDGSNAGDMGDVAGADADKADNVTGTQDEPDGDGEDVDAWSICLSSIDSDGRVYDEESPSEFPEEPEGVPDDQLEGCLKAFCKLREEFGKAKDFLTPKDRQKFVDMAKNRMGMKDTTKQPYSNWFGKQARKGNWVAWMFARRLWPREKLENSAALREITRVWDFKDSDGELPWTALLPHKYPYTKQDKHDVVEELKCDLLPGFDEEGRKQAMSKLDEDALASEGDRFRVALYRRALLVATEEDAWKADGPVAQFLAYLSEKYPPPLPPTVRSNTKRGAPEDAASTSPEKKRRATPGEMTAGQPAPQAGPPQPTGTRVSPSPGNPLGLLEGPGLAESQPWAATNDPVEGLERPVTPAPLSPLGFGELTTPLGQPPLEFAAPERPVMPGSLSPLPFGGLSAPIGRRWPPSLGFADTEQPEQNEPLNSAAFCGPATVLGRPAQAGPQLWLKYSDIIEDDDHDNDGAPVDVKTCRERFAREIKDRHGEATPLPQVAGVQAKQLDELKSEMQAHARKSEDRIRQLEDLVKQTGDSHAAQVTTQLEGFVEAQMTQLRTLLEDQPEDRVAQLKDFLETQVKQLGQQIKIQIKAEVTQLTAGSTRLKATVTQLKAEVSQFHGQTKELKAEATQLKAEVKQLHAHLETQTKELKAEVTQLHAHLETQTKELKDHLEAQTKDLKAEVTTQLKDVVGAQFVQLNAQIAQLDTRTRRQTEALNRNTAYLDATIGRVAGTHGGNEG